MCRVWPLILRFDWSALPYLLCSFPGSSPSGRPQSVVPQSAPASLLGKSYKQRFDILPVGEASQSRKRAAFLLGQAFRSERRARVRSERGSRRRAGQAFQPERQAGVGGERRSSSARPSGRRGGPKSEASVVPHWLGLSVGEAGRSQKQVSFLLG